VIKDPMGNTRAGAHCDDEDRPQGLRDRPTTRRWTAAASMVGNEVEITIDVEAVQKCE
jgi:hypothetical protein